LCKLNRIDQRDESAYAIVASSAGGSETNAMILIDASSGPQRRLLSGKPACSAALAKLDAEESFALAPDETRCYFIGRDRTGTLYSVYHFLEQQGIRWYAPGERDEVVPGPKAAALPSRPLVEKRVL